MAINGLWQWRRKLQWLAENGRHAQSWNRKRRMKRGTAKLCMKAAAWQWKQKMKAGGSSCGSDVLKSMQWEDSIYGYLISIWADWEKRLKHQSIVSAKLSAVLCSQTLTADSLTGEAAVPGNAADIFLCSEVYQKRDIHGEGIAMKWRLARKQSKENMREENGAALAS